MERLSDCDTAKVTAAQHFIEQNLASNAEVRAFLGRWGLGGKLASETPIGMLSGGQKVLLQYGVTLEQADAPQVRFALALLLHRPPHLL